MNHKEESLCIINSKLHNFQKDVINECIHKGSCGVALTMGFGKTICSLSLALQQSKDKPSLIIVSKTLINSWITEIEKFSEGKLRYIVFHKDYIKNIDKYVLNDIDIVITTHNVLSKYYKEYNIEQQFINKLVVNYGQWNQHTIVEYRKVRRPYLTNTFGGSLLHGTNWGCLIIDEMQKYLNIQTDTCRSICSISADFKYGMSGTIITEPKIDNILGYHILINHSTFPRQRVKAMEYIKSDCFKGYGNTMIVRKEIPNYIMPELNEQIIYHNLTNEEVIIYISIKKIIFAINKLVTKYKIAEDTGNARKFSSYLLGMITYLRQSIVCPLLPIANAALDVSDLSNSSELSVFIMDEIKDLGIDNWLNSPNSIYSTRVLRVLDVISKHKDEQIILFMSYRTIIDLFKNILKNINRPLFIMTSTMNSERRKQLLLDFKNSKDGIIFLSYQLGSEGLNLQSCKTLLLIDQPWNKCTTNQAIARIYRQGQTALSLNIYYFISNIEIERCIMNKQKDKITILNELSSGKQTSKIEVLKVQDIIKILEDDSNEELLQEVINMKI